MVRSDTLVPFSVVRSFLQQGFRWVNRRITMDALIGVGHDARRPFVCPFCQRFGTDHDHLDPEPTGAPLRYSVKVHNGSPGATGDRRALSPQPLLGSYAPFPYGHASAPSEWGPVSENPVFLTVPPFYDGRPTSQNPMFLSVPPLYDRNKVNQVGF